MPSITVTFDLTDREADALDLLRGEEAADVYLGRLAAKDLRGQLAVMAADLRRAEVDTILRAAEDPNASPELKETLSTLLATARDAVEAAKR